MRSILIDLSGTLHIEDLATTGAVQSLRLLYSQPDKFQLKFVTNTTKESSRCLHQRLVRCGFDYVKQSDIFSSLSAARRLIQQKNLRPMLFLEDEAMEDFKDIDTSNPNCVVIGLAPSKFDFQDMNTAFKLLLHNHEAELIAIHKGRYYMTGEGMSLGPGPYVECLQFATGKRATVVGKPKPEFFRQALASINSYNQDLDQAVMVGDDVRDDVLGAINFGPRLFW
uniref:Haloacid dehalogenase-like hydrolase domain-containing protein 2 n=1 Tax=Ditylenchus dipsaci TaxID=166011 RepID=A0A915D8D1_9BILA